VKTRLFNTRPSETTNSMCCVGYIWHCYLLVKTFHGLVFGESNSAALEQQAYDHVVRQFIRHMIHWRCARTFMVMPCHAWLCHVMHGFVMVMPCHAWLCHVMRPNSM